MVSRRPNCFLNSSTISGTICELYFYNLLDSYGAISRVWFYNLYEQLSVTCLQLAHKLTVGFLQFASQLVGWIFTFCSTICRLDFYNLSNNLSRVSPQFVKLSTPLAKQRRCGSALERWYRVIPLIVGAFWFFGTTNCIGNPVFPTY